MHKYLENPSKEFLSKLLSQPVVIDLETTGLEHDCEIVNVVVAAADGGPVYMMPPHVAPELNQAKQIIGHNLKFDLKVLHKYAPDLHKTLWRDTMLLHHLVAEEKSHALDDIIQERYQDKYKELFWSKHKAYTDASLEERTEYACKDVFYTRSLYHDLMRELERRGIPLSLCGHVHSLARTLIETELQGIAIDLEYLTKIGAELKTQIESLKPKMREMVMLQIEDLENEYWVKEINKRKTDAGRARVQRPDFSFDSPKQLSDLLYLRLGIKQEKTTKTKQPSVDDKALEMIESSHPLIPMIREYRTHQKVYTSYIEGTLTRMRDGRIYPSFNINGTVTGRISSSNPNMQQLPKDGGVRGIYIPDPGHVFVTCDYSQLEVVLAAHFSQDANLLKIINEGASQHDITATALKIPRDKAKTVNFAMQFQCSHYKLMDILSISEPKAKKMHTKYWETYAGIKALSDKCCKCVDEGKPITNPFGRQRLFEVCERGPMDKAYRQAMNSLIQGTGADLTSWAVYTVDARLKKEKIGRAVFSVHDEIVIQVLCDKYSEAAEILKSTMIESGKRIELSLPLNVEVSGPLTRWQK